MSFLTKSLVHFINKGNGSANHTAKKSHKMKLLTDKQKQEIAVRHPLYSQDGKGKKAICMAKFFLANWTWYIMEGNIQDDDFLMFGVTCTGRECEFGYISFNELQSVEVKVKTPFGMFPLKVERDLGFKPCRLEEIDDAYLQSFLNRLYPKEEDVVAKA